MDISVLTTRQLPLPDMEVEGRKIRWVPIGRSDAGAEAPVLVSTSLDTLDADYIASLPASVRLIANLGIGVDHIDFEAASARAISVSNTPVVTEDTADLTFALLLAASRKLGINERFLRAGHWSASQPMAAMGRRVHGQTLGLIGFGKIGQAVARRAAGFDMEVLYFDPHAEPAGNVPGVAVPGIEALIARSDFVSLHAPLLPATRHIINAERLRRFRAGAVLINAARGPLVDEEALAQALASGQLGGAGLDVFEAEPVVHAGLLACDTVVLTPHIGSATDACRQDIAMRGLQNVHAFLTTGKAIDIAGPG